MLPSAAAVLEDDNLLSEILLRLPSQPSSLPRVFPVGKRWRSLASDPGFSHRFRIHHRRNPPLLGCFVRHRHELRFQPTLEPPNRLPEDRFPFPIDAGDRNFTLLGCRHGFFLLMLRTSHGHGTRKLLVWDPVNGHEHPLAIPQGFGVKAQINGAVIRAALGDDTNHFQVVLVSTTDDKQSVIACVYSSDAGVWGDVISTPLPSPGVIAPNKPAVLIRDSIYMLLLGKPSSIIEFDVGRQSLAVIPLTMGLHPQSSFHYSVMRAEGGGLGLLFVSASARLWKWEWKTGCDGFASWVPGRTVELDKLLSPHLQNLCTIQVLGIAEENNVVFLWSFAGVFMLQLDSMQFKELPEINLSSSHPFECVYDAGI